MQGSMSLKRTRELLLDCEEQIRRGFDSENPAWAEAQKKRRTKLQEIVADRMRKPSPVVPDNPWIIQEGP